MAEPPSRREVLTAGSLTATTLLGGCLLNNPETAAGHLYVENTSGQEVTVALWVAETGNGTPAPVVQGEYRVPDNYALEFENAIEPDRTYSVRAALTHAGGSDSVSVTVTPCDGDPQGDRIVSLRTRPDGMGVIPFGCEESYTQRELEYVAASEYETGEIEGTVAAPAGNDTNQQTEAD